jgi:large subunit ribosomal protein L3
MLDTSLATKQKMGQTFVEGTRVPVTWVKVGPCVVTQIKTIDKDGYWAIQLGIGEKKIKNITKPLKGHLRGALEKEGKKAPLFLREIKIDSESDLKVGDKVNLADVFKVGDLVTVTGLSKGKGFAGVVKRWHFAGGPKTHGESDRWRAPGSIGQGTTPGRVYKGKHMAGRMGQDRVTVKNLIVTEILPEESLMAISGPLPGGVGNLLLIKKTASGKLEELVEEAPEVVVQEVPEKEGKAADEGSKPDEVKEEKNE